MGSGHADCENLSLLELEHQLQSWLLDGEVRQLSKTTLANRRVFVDRLLWFVRQHKSNQFGALEAKRFLAYLNNAHESADGRWGNARRKQSLRPASSKFYFKWLKAFCRFLVEEGVLDRSPVEGLEAPIVRQDQIQPFTPEEIAALLAQSRKTRHSRRDEAILLLLLDTGLRASELVNLNYGDLDMSTRRVTVVGKGNKRRTVFFQATTAKALWSYLREDPREAKDPLFVSDRGEHAGEKLTRSGLLQLIERMGKAAGIKGARCSLHTLRHTFAITYLRNGGDVFALQQLLGHTSLTMTRRYFAFVEGDLEKQHRQFSPVESLKQGAREERGCRRSAAGTRTSAGV